MITSDYTGVSFEVETSFDLTTLQGVYDHVATALLKQGRKAMNGTACRYLTDRGDRCAAGHLMPAPSSVLLSLRGGIVSWDSPASAYLDKRIPRTPAFADLIQDLQITHDLISTTDWLPEWKRYMLQVAARHELDPVIIVDAIGAQRVAA